jgi:hypothetical protein
MYILKNDNKHEMMTRYKTNNLKEEMTEQLSLNNTIVTFSLQKQLIFHNRLT